MHVFTCLFIWLQIVIDVIPEANATVFVGDVELDWHLEDGKVSVIIPGGEVAYFAKNTMGDLFVLGLPMKLKNFTSTSEGEQTSAEEEDSEEIVYGTPSAEVEFTVIPKEDDF